MNFNVIIRFLDISMISHKYYENTFLLEDLSIQSSKLRTAFDTSNSMLSFSEYKA